MGKFKRGSLNPPAQPPAVVDGGNNPPPASCLIDRVAYIADVTNASTATCNTTDNTDNHGVTIQVTFVVGDPPQVSYLCAHCIGSQFAYEPIIVATEGRLALLAIDIGRSSSGRGRKHYIYYAGDASRGMDPSLKWLPDPDPAPQSLHRFYDGVSSCGPAPSPNPNSKAGSDTNKWSIQDQEAPLLLLQHQQQRAAGSGGFDFVTNKAISIGREHATMCFVDLQQGMLQCNVHDSNPGLRYYPLAPPLENNPVTMVQSYPQAFRDVAIIDGGRRIKCAQLHLDVTLNCEDSNWGDWTVPSYHGWKAATWSMDTTHPSSGWRQDSEVVHASEIGSTIHPALLQLPPHEFDGDQGPPLPLTFEKLHTSLPVISLHDDGKDIVYFMTKVHSYHKAALVIAVDMSNKTAQQVTQFLPGKFMERAFVHSRISKFLSMAPALAPRLNCKRKPETTWDDDANSMDVLMNGTVMM
uniref:Uncharacterized protein n=1 Tax=Aegilops tauschii TaxID=37682 RepID=M8C7Z9_AEGTA